MASWQPLCPVGILQRHVAQGLRGSLPVASWSQVSGEASRSGPAQNLPAPGSVHGVCIVEIEGHMYKWGCWSCMVFREWISVVVVLW
jgi:hypothetical protein